MRASRCDDASPIWCAFVVVTDNRRHFLSALRYRLRVESPSEYLKGLKIKKS